MHSVTAVKGFEDGLVGSEVSKLDERRDGVKDLKSTMNAFVVDQRRANA